MLIWKVGWHQWRTPRAVGKKVEESFSDCQVWTPGWLFCAGAEEVLRGPGRAVSQPPVRAEVHAGPRAEHATIQQPEVGSEDSEVPEGRWHSAPEAGDVPPTTLGGFSWGHVGGHVSEGPKEELKDISVELQPEIAVGGGLPDLIGGNEPQKCAEPKRPAEAEASPLEPPATKRRADPEDAKAEIARILQVPEQQPEWGLEALGLQPPPEGAEAAVRAAAKAFRSMARKIHPDGRQRLTEEDELRCHEALAKLQRARRAVHRLVGCVPFKAPRRPELLECRAMGPTMWRFTWKVSPTESSRPVTRYELRAEDGGFFVTIAEVDPSAAAGGFELKEEQLSSRIRTSLHATGCLRVRVAAVGRGGVASSEEVAVRLAEGGEGTAATQTQTSTCAKRKMKDVFW
ncbi:unnamed protein product [Symbiodinium natans]|uniref:J domain-containing protein n=1 Tax=Symbiodinium natans TaxID=878477 RepID=A0A812PYX0_9DINO|nr:unnamed protein product [Symbiodinium natans]